MAGSHQQSEAIQRGARMLRTALGAAIAGFLEDPQVVEVMLNPDGRLWIDRLSEGLSDTGERLSAADGERIMRLVAIMLVPKCTLEPRGCRQNFPRQANASKACCRQS